MWYLICLMSMYVYGADLSIEIMDESRDCQRLSSSRQELAEIIIDSFFQKPDTSCKKTLAPQMEQLLEHESDEFCILLAVHSQVSEDLSPIVADQVSERVLSLFTQTVEIVIEKQQKSNEDLLEKKRSRCKKSSVIILTTLISLASAAGAAAISAAITSALT